MLKELIDMESNLAGLYILLSAKSRKDMSATFKKIGIDSMGHGQILKMLKDELSGAGSFSESDIKSTTEKVSEISREVNATIKCLAGVKAVGKETLAKLEKLEN